MSDESICCLQNRLDLTTLLDDHLEHNYRTQERIGLVHTDELVKHLSEKLCLISLGYLRKQK